MFNSITVSNRNYKVINLPGRPLAILDRDVAQIYEVETKRINQARTRNPEKFPNDFVYQLNENELEILKSQIVISNFEVTNCDFKFKRI